MNTQLEFKSKSFGNRLKSMLKADFRRMFTSKLVYIMIGICLVVPILVLVMVTSTEGTVTIDPNTGEESVMKSFDNAWQIIGTVNDENSAMSMNITSMCNFNLLYFGLAVLAALFVSEDFKSGYAKNIFTVRAKRGEYVASKTIVCCIGGILMSAAFFIGAIFGGAAAGLSFDLGTVTIFNLVMCMLSKIFLIAVFVPIFLAVSTIAKQKTWLGILLSCTVGMLLFMMIPMMTPLNSAIMNVILCLAGGAMFSIGLGAVSTRLLKKRDLV